MLELRPGCEACGAPLPPNSGEAMICSFECTFCRSCVNDRLSNVCPNCGGGFTLRPVRPREALERFPAGTEIVGPRFDEEKHRKLRERYGDLPPRDR